jgi:hypothetical protein
MSAARTSIMAGTLGDRAMFTKTHLAIAVVAAVASMLWTVAFGQPDAQVTRAEVKAVTRAPSPAR